MTIDRLSCSPHWVWVAIDPVQKLLLTIDVGERTVAMAQEIVHQLVQVLAPDCVPLFMTDGFKEYATALLANLQWVQPSAPPGYRPVPRPAGCSCATATLCTGGEVVPASTPRPRQPLCRLWQRLAAAIVGPRRAGLAHQHGLH